MTNSDRNRTKAFKERKFPFCQRLLKLLLLLLLTSCLCLLSLCFSFSKIRCLPLILLSIEKERKLFDFLTGEKTQLLDMQSNKKKIQETEKSQKEGLTHKQKKVWKHDTRCHSKGQFLKTVFYLNKKLHFFRQVNFLSFFLFFVQVFLTDQFFKFRQIFLENFSFLIERFLEIDGLEKK